MNYIKCVVSRQTFVKQKFLFLRPLCYQKQRTIRIPQWKWISKFTHSVSFIQIHVLFSQFHINLSVIVKWKIQRSVTHDKTKLLKAWQMHTKNAFAILEKSFSAHSAYSSSWQFLILKKPWNATLLVKWQESQWPNSSLWMKVIHHYSCIQYNATPYGYCLLQAMAFPLQFGYCIAFKLK